MDLSTSTDSSSPSKLAMLVGDDIGVLLFLTGEDVSLSLISDDVDTLLPANVKSRVSSTK